MDGREEEDATGHEYAWEGMFDRTWEAIEEGADGMLHSHVNQRWQREGRSAVHVGVKRGVMRCVFVIIDCSRHAGDSDIEMKPSRLAVMQDVAADFVGRFFDLNPVSSLAVLITRNAKAEALTPLSCNARQHVQAIRALTDTSGEASLQNVLELARESLVSVASFVSREVMLLSSSLTTCDPGDLHATVAQLSQSRVRCSVFSLLAEVYICHKIAKDTGGEFAVAMGPDHLRDMVMQLLPPRPVQTTGSAPSNSLVRVGFPQRRAAGGAWALCFEGGSLVPTISDSGYACPQCGANHAEIPTECPICGLKLLSSADLTKTYHHLFPLARFAEERCPPDSHCYACGDPLRRTPLGEEPGCLGYRCPDCGEAFCPACDNLLHDSLHACPSCLCREPSSKINGNGG